MEMMPPPDNPQLTVDTSNCDIEDCVQQLVDYVEANFRV
jgi:adenylylsulfate kinase-like enzyme